LAHEQSPLPFRSLDLCLHPYSSRLLLLSPLILNRTLRIAHRETTRVSAAMLPLAALNPPRKAKRPLPVEFVENSSDGDGEPDLPLEDEPEHASPSEYVALCVSQYSLSHAAAHNQPRNVAELPPLPPVQRGSRLEGRTIPASRNVGESRSTMLSPNYVRSYLAPEQWRAAYSVP
jgi:hypothetical protein